MPIAKAPDVGSVGLILDIPAWEAPAQAWGVASNVRFHNGLAERVPGYESSYGTVAHAPYMLLPCLDASGNRYVVYPGLAKVGAVQGTTHYNITRSTIGDYAASADTKWTGGVIHGVVVLQDGQGTDDPQFWEPQAGGNLAKLTNWPDNTKARLLRVFKNYLFAMDITETSTRYPYRVRWSSAAAPGTLPLWAAAATNDAGRNELGDSEDYIVDALRFGEQLAIYREASIYMVRYIAGQSIFEFARVPNNVNGMLANNCAAAFPGGHVVLGASDVYVFNGQATETIAQSRIRRWLFSNISSANYKRSFVVANPKDTEIWVCIPTGSSATCNVALTWNWRDNTWGMRELPSATCGTFAQSSQVTAKLWSTESGTWADATDTWDVDTNQSAADQVLLIGSGASKIHIVGALNSFDGSDAVAMIERTGMSLGDAQRVKFVRGIWPRFDGSTGEAIELTIGTQMQIDEPVSWGTALPYVIGSNRKVDVNKSGRFIGLRVRSNGTRIWRLKSFDVDVQPQGLW